MLDIGIYAPVASLWEFLGFKEIYGVSKDEWAVASKEHEKKASSMGKVFRLLFLDVEREPLPFENEFFDVVVMLEVIEHFSVHPWHAISEINRVMKRGGIFVITSPNAISARILAGLVMGRNSFSDAYNGIDSNRHNRLYSLEEIREILACGGFKPLILKTVNIYEWNILQTMWLWGLDLFDSLLRLFRGKRELMGRGDMILAVGKKVGVAGSPPCFLYIDPEIWGAWYKAVTALNGSK